MRRLLAVLAACAALTPAAWPQSPRTPEPRASGEIGGVLVHALSGDPVAGAEVAIAPTTRRDALVAVVTGADGRFQFHNLAPGKYVLLAQKRGFRSQTFNQHGNYSSAVAVGSGVDSVHLVFRLQPDAAISGRITDEQNDAVSAAMIFLFRDDTESGLRGVHRAGQTATDADGYFFFSHLAPGRYLVAAVAQPWYARVAPPSPDGDSSAALLDVAYPATYYPDATYPGGASPIVVKAGDRAEANLTMRAVPAVHVRVPATSASDYPDINLMQPLFDESYYVQPSITATESGLLLGGIAPGRYVFTTDGGNRRSSVDLSGDTQINAKEVPASVVLTGTVKLGADPPASLTVELVSRDTGAVSDAPVQGGRFDFRDHGLEAGRYHVYLANAGDLRVGSLAATGARVRGHTIELSGAEPASMTIFAAAGVGQVDGVALRDGKPMAGAMVVLVPADPDGDLSLFRRDQSDSDGTFSLLTAVPGKYTVVAIEDGWELEWGKPEVLTRYLARGVPVEVQGNRLARVEVTVQPK